MPCKGKPDLKEVRVFPLWKKKITSRIFVFTLSEVLLSSNEFQEGHSSLHESWLLCLPLSPRGLLELSCQGLHASMVHGLCTGWLRRECSTCLCHCCGAGPAELKEELAHGFPFLSSHVSTSNVVRL